MRIRTMELPSAVVDDEVVTEFVVILDRCTDQELANGATLDQVERATGARGVLAFPGDVEVGDNA